MTITKSKIKNINLIIVVFLSFFYGFRFALLILLKSENKVNGKVMAAEVTDCFVYGINDKDAADSEFFKLDPNTNSLSIISTLAGYDLEGLAIHPTSHLLYASSNFDNAYGQPGSIYTITADTGVLHYIGSTGFSQGLGGIAFRPGDNTLWGAVWNGGIIKINSSTGLGTLIYSDSKQWGGIAWSLDGKYLYLTEVGTTNLWRYDPIANNLGGGPYSTNLPTSESEGLVFRNDGILLGSIGLSGSADLFSYDIDTKTTLGTSAFPAPFDDVEPVVWPLTCTYPHYAPACSVTLTPQSGDIIAGSTVTLWATIPSPASTSIQSVTINETSGNANVKICPDVTTGPCTTGTTSAVDSIAPWTVRSTFSLPGTYMFKATGLQTSGSTCSSPVVTYVVKNVKPWWQVGGGDIISVNGGIQSLVPATCTAAKACSPYFNLDNSTSGSLFTTFNSPGLISLPGILTVPGPANISSTNWVAKNSTIPLLNVNYQHFHDLMNGSIDNSITAANVKAKLEGGCSTPVDGYCLYASTGDLIIADNINIGNNKVILFVPGVLTIGDVTPGNTTPGIKVNLTKGLGFLMVIAKGNILIGSNIGADVKLNNTAVHLPEIEGIYFSDEAIKTVSKGRTPAPDNLWQDKVIHIRGMLIARGLCGCEVNSIDFGRSLADNSASPAEIVEYAPDLYLRFPSFFGKPAIDWSEVQP